MSSHLSATGILICWLVLGLIAGIIDITRVDSGTYYADCPDNLTDVDGECCAWEVQDKVVAIPGTCSDYDTAVTVQGVTQIGWLCSVSTKFSLFV